MRTRFFWLGWVFIFMISPGALYAAPGTENNGFVSVQPEMGFPSSRNINEEDPNRLAQSSEIIIDLEKKVFPGKSAIVPSTKPENDQDFNPDNPTPSFSAAEEIPDEETPVLNQPADEDLLSSQEAGPKDYDDPFAPPPEQAVPELKDPYQSYNRFMFNFNETFFGYVLEPVVKGWQAVMPEEGRIAILNLFDNALSPVKLVSSLAQGDWEKSGRVLSRLAINTTVGLGGMLDVAEQEYGIKNVNEDIGQALGHYEVPTGPYIVLPIFGPSTGRNVVGRVADSFLNPLFFASPSILLGAGVTTSDEVNSVSFILEDKKWLQESAVDEYESIRDAFHQYREWLIKN